MRRCAVLLLIALISCFCCTSARAQFGEPKKVIEPKKRAEPKTKPAKGKAGPAVEPLSDHGIRLDKQLTQRWQVGVVVKATGPCVGIFGTAAVPTDWPEQTVRIVAEEISPQVRPVQYRMLENGVRQMLVEIPQLGAGETAQALVTFEVTRSAILEPTDTSIFQAPQPLRLSKDISKFLGPSPMIETQSSVIQKLAKEVLEGKEDANAWTKVETIYDWVRDNVKYENGDLKGALAAVRDKTGDCEELTSLFIALCRVNKIPARTVWIPDHCYPEFYLVDDKGHGHWFPCQAAGTRSFGAMPEFRPVLQKGDNFKVPEKQQAQRYVAEFLKMKGVQGGSPTVDFVRKLLPAN